MSELNLEVECQATAETAAEKVTGEKPVWEKPLLEDVSEQVMAQPYIRFT
jgi:hypothetical protein